MAVSFFGPLDGDAGGVWSEADTLRLNLRNDQYLRPARFPEDIDFSDIRGGGAGGDGRDEGGEGGGGLGVVGSGRQAVAKKEEREKLILPLINVSWKLI